MTPFQKYLSAADKWCLPLVCIFMTDSYLNLRKVKLFPQAKCKALNVLLPTFVMGRLSLKEDARALERLS